MGCFVGADVSVDIDQQIDALRERIAGLMRENDRLESDTCADSDLEASEQKISENLDLMAALASQLVALEKQRQA